VKRLIATVSCLFLATGAIACDRLMKERKRVESLLGSASAAASLAAPAATPAAPAATVAVPAAPTVPDDQIPTPEDFEQAAAREITAANAQTELDRLKKDIGP
jgi:hypothetical protein